MTLQPAHRRIATITVGMALLIVFLVAGMTFKVPYVALSGGPTVNTLGDQNGKPVVSVSDAVDPHPKGHLNLTTVSLHDQMTLFQALGMWLSSDYELEPRELYYPPDQSVEQVQQQNVAQMSSSEANATAAALNYLHKPTTLGVDDVAPKGPSAGKLKQFDRIVSVNGVDVPDPKAVVEVLSKLKPGETIEVVVQRGNARLTEQIKLGERPDDKSRPYLGVTFTTMAEDPNTNITYNVGDIGGPSAGTMLTLSIIDQMTPGDLSAGKFVAGTGTIKPDGTVGPIGGITHKIKAARDAGATVFLVPAENCAAATSDTPDGIELVKIDTLTSAVQSLDSLDDPKATRPSCS
ncbi:MAG: PDZ domain-containing protein [Gordonia sp. (in: high G+C Gram-positive bacteria)]|uniref:YlbL family protein n=1 Tax=Gordonia sp. (in: high G+C Gram-positive bacteria) TaxID=84139 RepID=UPI003C73F0EF